MVTATVTETGGQSVNASLAPILDTVGRQLGSRMPTAPVSGLPVTIEWLVFDADARTVSADPVEVTVTRIEREWILREVRPVEVAVGG